jgi:HlyD family secretion protein
VAPQILLESQKQHEVYIAKWQAQKATVADAAATLQAKQADLEAAVVDVKVAEARVAVAESEARRLKAWVGYLKLYAPYDGIVVERNANTWDFVLPQTGDPSAEFRAPHLSPSGQAAPIYLIDRTDIVRIYVDVPERDADYIHVGAEAQVKIWAYRDEWIPATVTRLSWALNPKARTLRVEIDLPNPEAKILPGMYAYGRVTVERPNVRALPKSALTYAGGKAFIWLYEDGKAKRPEVQTGVTSGKWIEVINRGTGTKFHGREEWERINGSEQVLIGHKLSTLTDDAHVELDETPGPIEEESMQTGVLQS